MVGGLLVLGLAFGLAPPAQAIACDSAHAVFAFSPDRLIVADIGAPAVEAKFNGNGILQNFTGYDIAFAPNFDLYPFTVSTATIASTPRAGPATAIHKSDFISNAWADLDRRSPTPTITIVYDDASQTFTGVLGSYPTGHPLRL
jgi:hypothetical protein